MATDVEKTSSQPSSTNVKEQQSDCHFLQSSEPSCITTSRMLNKECLLFSAVILLTVVATSLLVVVFQGHQQQTRIITSNHGVNGDEVGNFIKNSSNQSVNGPLISQLLQGLLDKSLGEGKNILVAQAGSTVYMFNNKDAPGHLGTSISSQTSQGEKVHDIIRQDKVDGATMSSTRNSPSISLLSDGVGSDVPVANGTDTPYAPAPAPGIVPASSCNSGYARDFLGKCRPVMRGGRR